VHGICTDPRPGPKDTGASRRTDRWANLQTERQNSFFVANETMQMRSFEYEYQNALNVGWARTHLMILINLKSKHRATDAC
jgi:hypothetical protein